MGPASFRFDHSSADAGFVLRDKYAGERAQSAAFADLFEERGGKAIALANITIAIFGPTVPAPVVMTEGEAGGDRQEVFGQRRIIAQKTTGSDRLFFIDYVVAIESADGFIAVQREIDRPFVVQRNALGQAIGGKSARAIFSDFLLVHAADDASAVPRRNVDTDPGCPGIDILAIGNLIGADDLDILGDGIAGREAVPRGEINAFVLTAQSKFGLRIQFQLAVEQLLGRAQPDEPGLVLGAIGQPVIGIDETCAERPVLRAIFQFGGTGAAAGARRQKIFLIAGDRQRQILADPYAGVDTEFTGAGFGGIELAQAIAGRLTPDIGEQIEFRTMMLGFDQPGGGGLPAVCRGDRFCFIVGDGQFRAEFGSDVRAIADINAEQIGFDALVLVMHRGRADF